MLYWTDLATLYVLGAYGVYIFVVLSKASMCVAYSKLSDNQLSRGADLRGSCLRLRWF